ncbi:MAG: hypothetical protein LBP86_11620 [Azoarcus sp.]|jgi:hypothetical protein|nr:hypothetical protein [Azoarcus sp.]
MFCTSCGANLGTRSLKFCLQCGAPLKPRSGAEAPLILASFDDPLARDAVDFLDELSGADSAWEDRYSSASPSPVDTGIGSAVAAGLVCVVLGAAAGGAWWFFSQPEAVSADSGWQPPMTVTSTTPPDSPGGISLSSTPSAAMGDPVESAQAPQTGPASEGPPTMTIKNLPDIQQAGRHNNPNIEPLDTIPSSRSSFAPPLGRTNSAASLSSARAVSGQADPPPAQSGQFEIFEPPGISGSGQTSPSVRSETQPEIPEQSTPTEPRQTARIASENRRLAEPPWLEQMREDLRNCADFFCREKVRRQRCRDRWKNLPECKSVAL